MPEKGNCRSCGRPVLWVRSAATGSIMPLDAEPTEDGNVILVGDQAHVLKGDLFEPMLEGPRYLSHFATCVGAAQHRKRKEKKK